MSSRRLPPSPSLTRRSLLRTSLSGALGVGLASPAVSLLGHPALAVAAADPPGTPLVSATPPPPMGPTRPPTVPVTVVPPLPPTPAPSIPSAFQAYHGVTGSTHQTNFNTLSANGYRMISLSIYGDPNDPRYAAVWILRPGPAFLAMHGVTVDEFASRYNTALAQGFGPTLISATGPASNPRYAAVFEQGADQGARSTRAAYNQPYAPDSDPNSFVSQFKGFRDGGYVPRSFAIYSGYTPGNTGGGGLGIPAERRWAATFQPSIPGATPWIFTTYVIDADTYQQAFTDLSQQGYRPGALAVTFDRQFAAVFVTAPAVGNWIGRHNLTADQYQQAFTDATAQGLIPLSVQGGGVGDDTRYAAIFAQLVP